MFYSNFDTPGKIKPELFQYIILGCSQVKKKKKSDDNSNFFQNQVVFVIYIWEGLKKKGGKRILAAIVL